MLKQHQYRQPSVVISLLIYLIFLFYALHQVYFACQDYIAEYSHYGFEKGWNLLSNRWRDNMDYEWESWKTFLYTKSGWFVAHCVLSAVTRIYSSKNASLVHAIVGCAFIFRTYGFIFSTLLIVKNATFYYLPNSRTSIWGFGIFWILFINLFKLESFQMKFTDSYITDDALFQMIIIMAWNLLRNISFKLEVLQNKKLNFGFIPFLGYAFYFPTMFFGPFILFEKYTPTVQAFPNVKIQLKKFVLRLLWLLLWLLITEFGLHYFYVNNLQINHNFVETINVPALYGFGYLMGQFFFLKYFVFYGISLCFADFDLIEVPKTPRCIGSIHRYSMMWKYFDAGLYDFLYKFIYSEIMNTMYPSRILASLVTFMFVYFWHGFFLFVLVWSVLNFISLQLEYLIKKYLNSNSFMFSQLFIFSAIANFFFISGSMDIGRIFLERTYINTNLISYLGLSFCCYFMFNFCEILEKNRKTVAKN